MIPNTTFIPESEERAFVIISNNEVKTADLTYTDLLDLYASLLGITRMATESDGGLRTRMSQFISTGWNNK